MGIAVFYHLTRSPLEAAMPAILGKAIAQGWRVVVRGTDLARMEWLDQRLWLGPEEGFLPHGLAGGPHDALQPVLLTTGPALPADAMLMTVDGAQVAPVECADRERVWVLFDGNDPAALEVARGQWRTLTEAGIKAQYWSEESGRWQMKIER